jgi:hypothetical protein
MPSINVTHHSRTKSSQTIGTRPSAKHISQTTLRRYTLAKLTTGPPRLSNAGVHVDEAGSYGPRR